MGGRTVFREEVRSLPISAIGEGVYTVAMKSSGASTVLQVKDVQAALKFYCDVLGFEEDFRYGNYAGIHAGELSVHLCEHTIWKRPVGGGAVVIYVKEVDAYCAEVEARGAKIEAHPADQEYGLRDFVLSDPDGNVLTFAADLPAKASGD